MLAPVAGERVDVYVGAKGLSRLVATGADTHTAIFEPIV
jgi:hypothetical protein